MAEYAIVDTTMRPVQSLGGLPRSAVLSESELPPSPPPQESRVPFYGPLDLHHVTAPSSANVHQTPQAHPGSSSSRAITGGELHPDAEANLKLDALGGGRESALRDGDDADHDNMYMASRADKMDADRVLSAEAEARHNLPRGTSQQSPSDPPLPHAGVGLGGTGDSGWDIGVGTGNGANDGQSHDGDADADAEGEMDVEEDAQDATASIFRAVGDESGSSAAGASSGKPNYALSGPIPPLAAGE
jgi:hypothetical protein